RLTGRLDLQRLDTHRDIPICDLRFAICDRPAAFDRQFTIRNPPSAIARFITSLGARDLADESCVLPDLIAELLIHSHDHRVRRFDVLEGSFEAVTDLSRTFDLPSSREDLIRQAWFARGLNDFEHPRGIAGQINLAQRGFAAEHLLKLLAGTSQ